MVLKVQTETLKIFRYLLIFFIENWLWAYQKTEIAPVPMKKSRFMEASTDEEGNKGGKKKLKMTREIAAAIEGMDGSGSTDKED